MIGNDLFLTTLIPCQLGRSFQTSFILASQQQPFVAVRLSSLRRELDMSKARQERPVLVRENEDLVELHPKSHQEEHDRHVRIKTGAQRLDKRSAQGISGAPKKSGQGGKFTWEGPHDAISLETEDDAPRALDENDPNYVDEEEEAIDRQMASNVVEIAKTGNAPQTQETVIR